jgi:hypothetical protein
MVPKLDRLPLNMTQEKLLTKHGTGLTEHKTNTWHVLRYLYNFLGASANSQKPTISFIMSVRLQEQLSSHWMDFHEI